MTLKERREAAGLTTAQVAKKLDVTASAVYNWEYGYNGIIRKYQKRLARLYGCTVDELLKEGAGTVLAEKIKASQKMGR